MSYDLYFLRRPEQAALSREEFSAYFANRPNYTVQGSQAWYANEDTGVYFSFGFGDGSDGVEDEPEEDLEPPPDELTSTGLSFNINYFRPHFFGLEAEPELAAVVDA